MKKQLRTLILLFIVPTITLGQHRKLSITIDERLELLSAVQVISNYHQNLMAHADLTYKMEVQNTFGKFKDHEIVKFFKSMSESWFAFSLPATFIIHHKLPNLDKISDFTKEDLEAIDYEHKKDSLNTFLRLMAGFYKKSNFHQFFVDHKAFYDSVTSPIEAEAKRVDYIGIIENHYGQSNYAYNIILNPLQGDCGYGPMIHSNQGDTYYAIVGPDYDSKTFPIFNKEVLFQDLVIHEFSHSFCNPLIDSFYIQLQKDSSLLKPILQAQQEQGYGDWKSCLEEHFTRANEIVLSGIIYGDSVADKIYSKQVEEGKWIYLKGLVPLIRDEYVKHRKQYKTEKEIMPKVVSYFDREKKKNGL